MRKTALFLLVFSFIGAGYVVAGRPSAVFLLGQIGAGATVLPNPYNTLAQQLAEWGEELDARERALNERAATHGTLTGILAVAVGLIGALLALNYYLDWRRGRTPARKDDPGRSL